MLVVIGALAPISFIPETIAAALDMTIIDVRVALNELVVYGILQRVDGRYQVSHLLIYSYVCQHCPPTAVVLRQLAVQYMLLVEFHLRIARMLNLPDSELRHIMTILDKCAEHKDWQVVYGLAVAFDILLECHAPGIANTVAMEAGGDHSVVSNCDPSLPSWRQLQAKFPDSNPLAYRLWIPREGSIPTSSGFAKNRTAGADAIAASELAGRESEADYLNFLSAMSKKTDRFASSAQQLVTGLELMNDINDRCKRTRGMHSPDLQTLLDTVSVHLLFCRCVYIAENLALERGIEWLNGCCQGILGQFCLCLGKLDEASERLFKGVVSARKFGWRSEERAYLRALGGVFYDPG
jgi:hypothetical protein